MRPLFEKFDVQIFALSKDTVENAKKHHERDQLYFSLLADPALEVIKKYGLLHRNGFEFHTFYVLGIPIGWPTKFNQMAIPTTILIDESGIVRWIDKANDYRLRGDYERVATALSQVLSNQSKLI